MFALVNMADQGFKDAYREELKSLTHPEKALINSLSMLAEDNKPHAQAIVTALEMHLHEVCIQRAAIIAGWCHCAFYRTAAGFMHAAVSVVKSCMPMRC